MLQGNTFSVPERATCSDSVVQVATLRQQQLLAASCKFKPQDSQPAVLKFAYAGAGSRHQVYRVPERAGGWLRSSCLRLPDGRARRAADRIRAGRRAWHCRPQPCPDQHLAHDHDLRLRRAGLAPQSQPKFVCLAFHSSSAHAVSYNIHRLGRLGACAFGTLLTALLTLWPTIADNLFLARPFSQDMCSGRFELCEEIPLYTA